MNLQYVGRFDMVELPGYGKVERGGFVSVPSGMAGHAPEERVAEAQIEMADAVANVDHHRCRALRAEMAELDYGSGLLAQSESWVAAPGVSLDRDVPDGVGGGSQPADSKESQGDTTEVKGENES